MTQEPEAIRQEMDETRNSLTDKIAMLEEKVVETVHDASNGVKDTVDAVKDAVQDTMNSMRSSVDETVGNVRETFSLQCQMERRPWAIMLGAVGAGFAAGYVLNQPAPVRASAVSDNITPKPQRKSGNGSLKEPSYATFGDRPPLPEKSESSTFDHLTQVFEKEIHQIKGLAIGTLAGVLRDLVSTTVPEMMRAPVNEVFNNITEKLGGQPYRGQFFTEESMASRDSSKSGGTAPNYPPRQTTL